MRERVVHDLYQRPGVSTIGRQGVGAGLLLQTQYGRLNTHAEDLNPVLVDAYGVGREVEVVQPAKRGGIERLGGLTDNGPHLGRGQAGFDELDGEAFTVPTHRAVHDAIRASGGLDEFTRILRSAEERFGPGEEATAAATRRFVSQVLEAAGDYLAPAVSQLAVAPLPVADHERMRSYCRGVVAAMVRVDLTRGLGQARAALQRMGEDDPGYAEAFRELMRLEQRRQNYTERD